LRQRLLIELEEKNKAIGKLQHEIADLKEQNEKHSDAIAVVEKKLNQKNESREGPDSLSSISTPIIDSEELIQLDHQIKEVLAKSLDFEEKLDAKLLIINTLEHKLDQLTVEIDGIKVFSVEDRDVKEY
jgi:chromosome segregation ATPase